MTSEYQKHRAKWQHCERCDLHKTRCNVCLVRGKLPCDVLFVGEAPGPSEDVIGRPFVGPAGKLLDRIIAESIPESRAYAVTNLVGCLPVNEDQDKRDPEPWAVKKCGPRLIEMLRIARPSLVVRLGKLATKWMPDDRLSNYCGANTLDLIHPAALLRVDITQKGLAVQREIIKLTDAVDDIAPF